MAGTLCISGNRVAWADAGKMVVQVQEEEAIDFGKNISADKPEDLQEEEHGIISRNEDDITFSREDRESVVSDNEILGDEDEKVMGLQKNEQETRSSVSDDNLSSNEVLGDDLTVSENWSVNEELSKRPLNVVLPTEIPFSIILLGEAGLKGVIDSKQFCIENKGYEDVRISIKGICLGEDEGEYIASDTSVKSGGVQGKKNIWMYLNWEDENGEDVDCPRIVMGDPSDPGEGEIALKAPKRNKEGDIKGKNPESKVYFSIKGDLYSDMGEPWKSNELRLDLSLSMKAISITDTSDVVDDPASGTKPLVQQKDLDKAESISNNANVSENQKSISDNEDISDVEKEVLTEGLDRENSLVSTNSSNMSSSTLVETEDYEGDKQFEEIDESI